VRPHVHDYWDGRRTVEVLNETFDLYSPATTSDTATATFGPRPQHTIYPGTKWVNTTLSWTETTGLGAAVFLDVSSASKSLFFATSVTSGKTNVVATNESDNDLAHAELS